MSYNGSGTFQINSTGQPVVTGTVISSTAFNALTADLATGLSTAITKDGQTTTTARIVFAQGVSSTLVTDATSATTGSIITAGGISTQKALWVGTTSRLVGNVQADGLLGIGMTPSNVLDITQTQNAASVIKLLNSNGGAASRSYFMLSNGTNYSFLAMNGTGYTTSGLDIQDSTRLFNGGAGGLVLQTSLGPLIFATNSTEVARLDTSGRLNINRTSPANVGKLNVSSTQDAVDVDVNAGTCYVARISGSTGNVSVHVCSGNVVGSITVTTSATAYNTSSDYRLKENVQPMTGGLATVAALKPVTYDWIAAQTAGEGFIAHELQAVIPAAVTGEKDAVDDKGEIKPQGVDFGKIVPHLVAAIQELTTRLAALETK